MVDMRKNITISKSKLISLVLAAAMMASFSGCEKKAGVVEGSTQAVETAASDTGKTEDGTYDEAENPGDSEFPEDLEYPEGEKWTEKIEGSGSGFDYVDVNVSFYDQGESSFTTSQVAFDTFDKDYVHNLCDRAFDGGNVEVYDYNHKTKRVYEDEIEVYRQAVEMAENVKKYVPEKLKEYICGFYHISYYTTGEMPEYKQGTEEFDTDIITSDMNKLISEAEKAPETIENDYSYQGYIGKIDGEEFYMYLGNRNLNEYYSSIDSSQMNGRVVTFMRSDLESAYCGDNESVKLGNGEIIEKDSDPDNPLFRKNCLLDGSYDNQDDLGIDAEDEIFLGDIDDELQNMTTEAEKFLEKLGYSSYEYTGWNSILYWTNAANDKFMFGNGYDMSSIQKCEKDGYIMRFAIPYENTDMVPYNDIMFDEYLESGDAFKPNSYAYVYVNEKGVLGCQIYNPATVMKSEEVSGIIDAESVKDIVRQSVDDKSVWNQPIGSKTVLFDVTDARVTVFPIHSKDNPDEYTFVPCYAIFKPDLNENPLPFMLINAIDGSIIKAEEELDNYPSGWQNGNVGYENHKMMAWPKLSGDK